MRDQAAIPCLVPAQVQRGCRAATVTHLVQAKVPSGYIMTDVQVRGGTFPPGTKCEYRDDQFHFDEDSVPSRDAKLYLGDALEARVVHETKETTTSPGAIIVLGAAAIGAVFGAWCSGFTMSFSILLGALLGGWLANSSDVTIPGQTTFEMRFSNDRSLVGTVDTSDWALILDAWRVLGSATPSLLRPAKA